MRKICILLFVILLGKELHASYLRNIPYEYAQPDGSKIQLYWSGDAFFSFYHDKKGHVLAIHPETGFVVYAFQDDGEIIPTDYRYDTYKYKDINIEKYKQKFLEKYYSSKKETGAAYLVNDEGYLITCYHLIKNMKNITVKRKNRISWWSMDNRFPIADFQDESFDAAIVAVDIDHDLALLKIISAKIPLKRINFRFIDFNNKERTGFLLCGWQPNYLTVGELNVSKNSTNTNPPILLSRSRLAFNTPVHSGGFPLLTISGEILGINTTRKTGKIDINDGSGYIISFHVIDEFLKSNNVSLYSNNVPMYNDSGIYSEADIKDWILLTEMLIKQRGPIEKNMWNNFSEDMQKEILKEYKKKNITKNIKKALIDNMNFHINAANFNSYLKDLDEGKLNLYVYNLRKETNQQAKRYILDIVFEQIIEFRYGVFYDSICDDIFELEIN